MLKGLPREAVVASQRVAAPNDENLGHLAAPPSVECLAVGGHELNLQWHLAEPDVKIANKIAKAIRFSSGGLRYVKSMGVKLKSRGLAQVSINLTDFEQTPMHRVFEIVRREAERYGCRIVGSEIVGLVPKKALEMAADFFLQLEGFKAEMVFENRLAAALAGAPMETSGTGKYASLGGPSCRCESVATGYSRRRLCSSPGGRSWRLL